MPLKKPMKNLKIAILVPCYKRPEYTERCIKALEMAEGACEYVIVQHPGDKGLRSAILDFFENHKHFDILAKMDNDCIVPDGWMDELMEIMDSSDVDILSPNVFPSDAAYTYGTKDPDKPYMPASLVGGLWCMKSEIISDMVFDEYDTNGLTGGIALLRQIIFEKDPVVGWAPDVIVQDLGHWSGEHPGHIKSKEHEEYSFEVGREIAWRSQ